MNHFLYKKFPYPYKKLVMMIDSLYHRECDQCNMVLTNNVPCPNIPYNIFFNRIHVISSSLLAVLFTQYYQNITDSLRHKNIWSNLFQPNVIQKKIYCINIEILRSWANDIYYFLFFLLFNYFSNIEVHIKWFKDKKLPQGLALRELIIWSLET